MPGATWMLWVSSLPQLGRELEPYHLFWLEDAVTGELQEGLRSARSLTVMSLAIGESFNSGYDCTTLITERRIDYLRMPLSHGIGVQIDEQVASRYPYFSACLPITRLSDGTLYYW